MSSLTPDGVANGLSPRSFLAEERGVTLAAVIDLVGVSLSLETSGLLTAPTSLGVWRFMDEAVGVVVAFGASLGVNGDAAFLVEATVGLVGRP